MASFKRRLANRLHPCATWLFGHVGILCQRLIYHSNRLTVDDEETLRDGARKGKTIFACWHGHLFYQSFYYYKRIQRPEMAVMVSQSRDGDFGTAVIAGLKMEPVRGSTSKGARTAIRTVRDRLKKGHNIVITPDGPRGPVYEVQIGVIKLAQMTGVPIVPICYDASRKKTFKSWDRFLLPLPFGHIHIAHGDPLNVPRRSTPEEAEGYRAQLEETMQGLNQRASQEVGN